MYLYAGRPTCGVRIRSPSSTIMPATTNKHALDAKPPKFPTLDDKLCFALYSSSLAMLQSYKPLLAAIGLTYPQYLAMLVLWEEDGITVKRLADQGMHPSAMNLAQFVAFINAERAKWAKVVKDAGIKPQ